MGARGRASTRAPAEKPSRPATRLRAIVFDLFDTLVDQNHHLLAPVVSNGRRVGATTPALHDLAVRDFGLDLSLDAFADRLAEVDAELRVETWDQGLEMSTLDRFAALAVRLGCSDPTAFARAATATHMDRLRAATSVPPHHEAVLTSLAIDYRLGLCSNFTHAETVRAVLRDAGFDSHLDAVVVSDEIGIRKPRREIFEAIAHALDVRPHEILHVGDNLVADIQGAAQLGMRTVWLTRQVADPEVALARHTGPRPDFALDDLLDLPVLVARLAS